MALHIALPWVKCLLTTCSIICEAILETATAQISDKGSSGPNPATSQALVATAVVIIEIDLSTNSFSNQLIIFGQYLLHSFFHSLEGVGIVGMLNFFILTLQEKYCSKDIVIEWNLLIRI